MTHKVLQPVVKLKGQDLLKKGTTPKITCSFTGILHSTKAWSLWFKLGNSAQSSEIVPFQNYWMGPCESWLAVLSALAVQELGKNVFCWKIRNLGNMCKCRTGPPKRNSYQNCQGPILWAPLELNPTCLSHSFNQSRWMAVKLGMKAPWQCTWVSRLTVSKRSSSSRLMWSPSVKISESGATIE